MLSALCPRNQLMLSQCSHVTERGNPMKTNYLAVESCSPKAEVSRSNRDGCTKFHFFYSISK